MKLLCLILLFATQAASAELKTVEYIDPGQYLGTWYQIARNPHPFETGCVCSRQVLTANRDSIGVYNSCNDSTPTGPLREIRGTATIDDPTSNARLTVDFGLPKKGQYWIIGVDPQYRWAVVSEPSMQTLYILSKTPQLPADLYQAALAEAAAQVDVSNLTLTEQNGCAYPPRAATANPASPSDPSHPGSKIYARGFEKQDFTCAGRDITVYLPTPVIANEKVPAVVYGHGQALGLDAYQATFEHLAKKGVATIFPMYDNGFFDQDWPRMGRDYATLTACAVNKFADRIAANELIFSGHSKGAYIASIAAGIAVKEALPVKAQALMLFQTAGFDQATIGFIEPATPTTVIFGDQDTVVQRNLSDSVFANVRSTRKQFIMTKSYPGGAKADHYWPQTKGSFFGGGPEGALHYYGAWKWLTAAAWDLQAKSGTSNPFVYGDLAADKGIGGTRDDIQRNF